MVFVLVLITTRSCSLVGQTIHRLLNEVVVDERIASEVKAGRLLGPLPAHLIPGVHISPMGLIPKPHQSNQFRLIVDLSHPAGGSVNDGISSSLCSLRYASVDEAVNIVRQLGRDTQLAKLDNYQGCLSHYPCEPS